jgi:ribosomal protein L14E/L6E/L27E
VTDKWYIEAIDRAVSERDFARLANLIRSPNLSAEDRDYLAKTVLGLLNGDIKAPNHRPKKSKTEWEAKDIAFDVVRLNRYRHEWTKLNAAVKKVAQDRGCSVAKVWNALRHHRGRAVWKFEEAEYEAMVDAAHEAEREAAVEHLKEEHGDREFSDEEVQDEIEAQRQAWVDFEP